jgi:hypothetical protein
VTKPFSSLSQMAKRCWALILKSATSSAIPAFPWWWRFVIQKCWTEK